jgi:hypothetical protein
MLALRTFKGPQIGMTGTKLDLDQHHATLTLRAARPFDGKQGWFWPDMRLGHVALHLIRREREALSVTDNSRNSGGDRVNLTCPISDMLVNIDQFAESLTNQIRPLSN